LRHANQTLGLDTAPDSELPVPVLPPPVAPVPAMPVLKVLLVDETDIPPVRKPHPERLNPAEDDLTYDLSPQPEGGDDIQRRLERDKVQRLLADAQRERLERHRRYRSWPREQHWYECLIYPLRATPQVFALAVAWATGITLMIAVMPGGDNVADFAIWLPLLPFGVLLGSYTLACLLETLAAARRGEAGHVAWVKADAVPIARSGVQGTFCFLAGPVVPTVLAAWFWLNSGDLEAIDRLIIFELGVVAAAYGALSLMAVQQAGRYRDAGPAGVIRLIQRDGWRVIVASLGMAVIVVCCVLLMFDSLEELHRGLRGWVDLLGCWMGMLFALLFVLRWLGLCRVLPASAGGEGCPSG
jgi:hypothetical protein